MRSREFITELEFGKARSYDFDPTMSTSNAFTFIAKDPTIGKIEVVFTIYPTHVLEIEYTLNESYGLTRDRSGIVNAMTILSTVKNIVTKELPSIIDKTPGLTTVKFTSSIDEPSRTRHYEKSVVPFISALLGPNWEYWPSEPGAYFKAFRWIKKEESEPGKPRLK